LIDETYLNDVTSDVDTAGPALASAITQVDRAFVARHIAAEQVRLLYRFSLVGYLAELMVTFLLGAILWSEIGQKPLLFMWFAAAFFVMLGRYVLYKLFIRANPGRETLPEWEKRFVIGALMMAALWGLMGALAVSASSPSHLPVMMLVALLCTGAVAYYAPNRTLLPYSVFLALLPMGVVTMGFGDYAGSMLGAATILLTGLLVAVHSKMHKALVESLNARFDNVLIAMRLEEERALAQQTTRALELESFDRRKAERSELLALQRLRLHLERTPMGVIEWDTEFRVTSWNPSAEAIFGYDGAEALGESAYMLVSGAQDSERLAAMWTELMHDRSSTRATLATKTRRGETIHTEWYNTPLVDGENRVIGVASLVQDITERLNTERTIHYMAHHDALTGLPNRRLMQDRLNQAILQARRENRHVALLFIDIDRFKQVNDTLGHETGDYVLRDVAKRLTKAIREGDTVSREGGDEFIIVLPDLEKAESAQIVATKILAELSQPIEVSGQELIVTASIGISHYPNDAVDVQQLLKHADSAMYQAKDSGRNTVRFFTSDLNFLLSKRVEVETRLRRAIEREEFFLRYQPQVDIQSGRVTGMEALLRWNDPQKGEVFPKDFISIAEELGLIVPLGEWVFRSACQQMMSWDRDGFDDISITINLSTRQFVSRKLLGSMKATLTETNVDARRIEIDITEAMAMRNLEQSIEIMAGIRRLGASICIDAFGIGYSSLGQLQRLNAQSLKIDRSLIALLPADGSSRSIVEAIIAMAKRLDLRVIAEGVEEKAQLEFLRGSACDAYLGYLFAKPLTVGEATNMLNSQRITA
jgi:diguanylate cyclase (GGDEF)-like protein/PAS domain S-box-containing protein